MAMDRPTTREADLNAAKTASSISLIAGIWLIIAPFVIGYADLQEALWNDILCGAAVLILAAIRISAPDRNTWLSWVNLVIGLWLIVAPFVLGYSEFPAPVWNDVILGIVIAGSAAWSAWATGTTHHHRPTMTT